VAAAHLERRLTAILAADVAGYSRLASIDEEGTHVQLKEHLRLLVDPKISEHRGHVVKNTGDGILAEFGSVVDAVRCALDVQRGMAERNAGLPRYHKISYDAAAVDKLFVDLFLDASATAPASTIPAGSTSICRLQRRSLPATPRAFPPVPPSMGRGAASHGR
jgi:hypothetical protein